MTPLPALDSPDAPKYWKFEVTGQLAAAVRSYLDNPESITLRELALLRAYVVQWIDSPAWDANPDHDVTSRLELEALRRQARRIACVDDFSRWLRDGLATGIDPL